MPIVVTIICYSISHSLLFDLFLRTKRNINQRYALDVNLCIYVRDRSG